MFWSKICKWTDVCASLDKAWGALEGEGKEEKEREREREEAVLIKGPLAHSTS